MTNHEPPFWHTGHVTLTPDERPHLNDGSISLGWNAGTIHVQYVGLPELPITAIETVSATMRGFNRECQLLSFLLAGARGSQEVIQRHLGENFNQDGAITISGYLGNIPTPFPFARLPAKQVLDAFAKDGEYEQLYAKAFVVFAYHLWDETTRPQVADALGVKPCIVKSDLMGELRHLRNWLIHPDEHSEERYFKNANILAKVMPELRPGSPVIKAAWIFPLMGFLNSLHVIVNPQRLDPALSIGSFSDQVDKQIEEQYRRPGWESMPLWRSFKLPPQDNPPR